MLVLNRKFNERIRLKTADGTEIWIHVVGIDGNTVKLGIVAPASVHIEREELIGRKPKFPRLNQESCRDGGE
jgi:carbon storage regulator CsrA